MYNVLISFLKGFLLKVFFRMQSICSKKVENINEVFS